MLFQINSSKLFLTYPQCVLKKEDVYEILLNQFEPKELLVAHELHKNGDHHLHVYMALNEPLRIRDPKFADLPGGYHGNYQGCRSAKNVLKYCTKEEDYVSNFDVECLLKRRSNRRELMSLLVKRQSSLVDFVCDNPEYLYGYSRLKLDYTTFFYVIKTILDLIYQFFYPTPGLKF